MRRHDKPGGDQASATMSLSWRTPHTTWNGRLPALQIIEHHNATLADLVHPDHIIKVKPAEAVNLS